MKLSLALEREVAMKPQGMLHLGNAFHRANKFIFGSAIVAIMAGLLVSGCAKVSFQALEDGLAARSALASNDPRVSPSIVFPGPIPEATPTPPAVDNSVQTSGTCTKGDHISACLACDYTVPEPAPWQPSSKAEKLAQIQFLSCPIVNLSDSPFKRPLTQLMAVSMVQACSELAYPETIMSPPQSATIESLLSPDPYLRNHIYGGLWYKPPYTDQFEEYFGVYHADIRRVFCEGEDPSAVLGANAFTSEYALRCMRQGDCDVDQWPTASRNLWYATQKARRQLAACMAMSRVMPSLAHLPGTVPPIAANKVCSWKKFEGLFELGGGPALDEMLSNGFAVSLETGNTCSLITSKAGLKGPVTLTAFKCL
jgi:hypothetical protein